MIMLQVNLSKLPESPQIEDQGLRSKIHDLSELGKPGHGYELTITEDGVEWKHFEADSPACTVCFDSITGNLHIVTDMHTRVKVTKVAII